jgi:hypothetical protein
MGFIRLVPDSNIGLLLEGDWSPYGLMENVYGLCLLQGSQKRKRHAMENIITHFFGFVYK